ncbi:hypothetical protein [Ochrobactrum sp. Marseille-Q0166]|uniref:hypothetical protein n=1 Tax=Ochrobactrum sp. Marseille-Q0166 TaxID=2761105 RepID=UPI0016564DA6|nr:hypothetical protein [Ochrobactrum sp. Marseille-Q0166]MBC8716589.1 hypothetical protein [Ochrobactrum sp. Marseille-Q0166]
MSTKITLQSVITNRFITLDSLVEENLFHVSMKKENESPKENMIWSIDDKIENKQSSIVYYDGQSIDTDYFWGQTSKNKSIVDGKEVNLLSAFNIDYLPAVLFHFEYVDQIPFSKGYRISMADKKYTLTISKNDPEKIFFKDDTKHTINDTFYVRYV